jgi:serine/threonine protein kinase
VPTAQAERSTWPEQALKIKQTDEVELAPTRCVKLKMGRYHLLRKLGEGGMGAVYEAYDPELGRKTAIKVLHPSDNHDDSDSLEQQNRARLLREAKNLAKLSHPNIVSIFDVGLLDDRSVFVTMEYVRGQTLRQVIEAASLSWQRAVEYVLQSAQGLSAAHAAGLLHRDFKPENVILDESGTIKVLDFGLSVSALATNASLSDALSVSNGSTHPSHASARSESGLAGQQITGAGVFAGTPGYMAPEQMCGQELDARTDLFALCCVAFELLTGKRPFPSRPIEDRLLAIAASRLKWPRHVPRWLRVAVARGLAHDPNTRGTSIQAWSDSIREHLARQRRRKTWILSTLASTIPIGAALNWPQYSDVPIDPECRDPTPQIDSIWNDSARSTLKDSFAATNLGVAVELAIRAGQALDQWRTAWIDAANHLCPKVRESLALENIDATLREQGRACLNESRAEVEVLLSVWKTPSSEQIIESNQAIATLSKPRDCANEEALRIRRPLPLDAGQRAYVLAQRTKMKAAQVQIEMADFDGAQRTLQSVQRTYNGEIDLDVHSEFTFASADLQFNAANRGFLPGISLYRGNLWAIAANNSRLEARILESIWYSRVYRGGLQDESEDLLREQESSVRRAGTPPTIAAQLFRNRAIWSSIQGDLDQAKAFFLQSLAQIQSEFGANSVEESLVFDSLGYVELLRDNFVGAEEYFRRVENIQRAYLPPGHPSRTRTTCILSEIQNMDNRLSESIEGVARGWQECIEAQIPGELCAEIEQVYATTAALRGELSTSVQVATHVAAIEFEIGRRVNPINPYMVAELSATLRQRGELQSALAMLETGLQKVRDEGQVHPNAIAFTLILAVNAAIANSRFERAALLLGELQAQLAQSNEEGDVVRSNFYFASAILKQSQRDFSGAIEDHETVIALEYDLNSSPQTRSQQYLEFSNSLLAYGDLLQAEYYASLAFQMHQVADGLLPHLAFPFHETLARVALAQQRYGDALSEIELAHRVFDPVQVLSNRLAPLVFTEAQARWAIDHSARSREVARELARRALAEYEDWDAGADDKIAQIKKWLRVHGPY